MIYSESLVQNHLYWYLKKKGHKFSMPCFTPAYWWECDMFSITASDYPIEYEIKLSKADFQKDLEKTKTVKREVVNKHQLIQTGKGLSMFYYVIPLELLEQVTVPDYAGVIVFSKHGRRLVFSEYKKAKRFKVAKVSKEQLEKIFVSSYYRFWFLRQKSLA